MHFPTFGQSFLFLLLSHLVVGSGLCQTPLITITSPAGGEPWAAGSSHVITWESDLNLKPTAGKIEPRHPTVDISFSTDGGVNWTKIADEVALSVDSVDWAWDAVPDSKIPPRSFAAPFPLGSISTLAGVGATSSRSADRVLRRGHFVWTVPNLMSAQCKIRVGSAETRAFAVTPAQEVPHYRWVKVTTQGPFAPRDGAGALVYDNRMWLIGGWNMDDKQHYPRITANDVWSSTDGANWTLVKPNTFLDQSFDADRDWEGRHTAGYVVFRGKMWIVGGDANQRHYQNDVWNSADGKTWTRVTGKVPWGPRGLQYTVVFKDKIWVIGGQTIPQIAPAEERFYRDIWTTTDGVNWEKVEPQEPYWSARGMIGGHAVFHDRLWILGGGTYDTPITPKRNYYNDIWSTADGVHWTRHLDAAPWAPRQYHDVAVFDNRLWLLEGYNSFSGNRKDVWHSTDGVNWYEVPDTPWKPRHASSIFVYRDGLWVVVGNNMESDVWRLERSDH